MSIGKGAHDRISALEELLTQRLDYMQHLMDERQAASRNALDLNAIEMHRRLEILNGEAGRLREMQISYMPREVCEKQFDIIMKDIDELREFAAHQRGKGQVIAAIVSAIVAIVIGLLVRYVR